MIKNLCYKHIYIHIEKDQKYYITISIKTLKCFNLVADGQQITVYGKYNSFQNIEETFWKSWSSCFGSNTLRKA